MTRRTKRSVPRFVQRWVLFWLAIALFALVAPTGAIAAEAVQRRVVRDNSTEQNVRRALGNLTYALRSGDPSLVAAEFAALVAPGAPVISEAEAASFFVLYHAPTNAPLVYFANPEIVIDGSLAVVRCLVHWQFVGENGITARLKETERLVFRVDGNNCVLTQARATPLVLKCGGDAAVYAKSLVEVDRAVAASEFGEGF